MNQFNIDYENYLQEFLPLYKERPIIDNNGGMKIPHMFAAYCLLKELKPKLIIESGVWRGQGTWLFDQIDDNFKLVCIEPMSSAIRYRSKNALYYTTKDFNTIDWNKILLDNNIDASDVLVFFDDHQDFNKRLEFILEYTSIKKIIYEDNYPIGKGDCISPKKITSENYENIEDKNNFKDNVDYYFEFPPLWLEEKTRWGDNWNDLFKTPSPIFSKLPEELLQFQNEMNTYTWMCYINLK